jgi:hypothetical protein
MSKIILSEPIPVRAASHARISFSIAAPRKAELVLEHLRDKQLLARESRPLAGGDRTLQIKTHPEASHIACMLRARGRHSNGVKFDVDCDQRIEPTMRHFIVLGAMKAGTTTLFELLAQNPAICRTWAQVPRLSFPKETNYFRRLYREGDTALHYDWRFPFDAARHAWTLDVSPSYTMWPGSRNVPARIASLQGTTKLAYILREPVDRIESHLAHRLHHGPKMEALSHCIRTSSYAMQLDKFTAHLPREDILLLDFEQLRRDPAAIQAQVCDFLAIDRFVSHSVVHNKRGIEFLLDAKQRSELTATLRPDVERLIRLHGFEPATKWLQPPVESL